MKLEQQVTSVELSKRLKELGVKQESLFYWSSKIKHENTGDGFKRVDDVWNLEANGFVYPTGREHCLSAFTVAELGEMLPDNFCDILNPYWLTCEKVGKWEIGYVNAHNQIHSAQSFEADTEADARAKTLIYLIENNLVEVSSVTERQ